MLAVKDKRAESLDKLKRIEGRVRGLSKMIEEGRSSEDVLMQISATYEAIRVVSKQIVQQYIEECVSSGLMATNSRRREEAYRDLLDCIYKYVK